MTLKIKLTSVDGMPALLLPEDVLEHLHAREGDELLVTQSGEGLTLHPMPASATPQLSVAEQVMREDRDLLRRLAE